MDVEPRALREQRLGDEQPVGADDDGRRAELEPGVGRSGWSTGMPSRSATSFAGGAASRRPRPAGASGRVSSDGDVVPLGEPLEHVRTERRRRGDGDARHGGLPTRARGAGAAAPSASRRDSGSVRSMMSVPSRWSSSCWTTRASACPRARATTGSPVSSFASTLHPQRPARPARGSARARGTPPARPRRRSPTGVTTGLTSTRSSLVERADEEPAEDPDLRRGEPDAVGVVHELDHPLGDPRELLVERLDLRGAHPQHGIAVLPDLGERESLADEPLGLGARLGVASARARASSCSWSCSWSWS